MSVNGNLRQEIDAANRNFMALFAKNDMLGVTAYYTEDAQLLVAHAEPIRGRAAIQAVFNSMVGQGHTLYFDSWELEGHGATAVEIGEYTRKLRDGQTIDRGKYLVIWKRVGDEWKIHRDMLATSVPRPS